MNQFSIGDPHGAVLDQDEITADPIPTDIFRDSLNLLYEAFMRAEAKYPLLRHQQLISPSSPLAPSGSPSTCDAAVEDEFTSTNEWAAFSIVNSPPTQDGWQEWHGPVQGECYEWFGRFSGYRDGLDEFRFLANTFYLVLRKLDPKLPEGGGFERLLDMMHQAAASWPTTFLRSHESTWGLTGEEVSLLDDGSFAGCDAISNKSDIGPNGVAFFVHPEVMTIEGNLFLAAAQFVKMIAHDDQTLFLSEMHFVEPDYPIIQLDGVEEAVATGRLAETGDGAREVSQGDFLLVFDRKIKKWHLRFRFGPNAEDVEDEWLPHSSPVEYVAFILERGDQAIAYTDILPHKSTKASVASHQSAEESLDHEGHLPQHAKSQSIDDKEALKAYYDEFNRLRQQIAAAKRSGDTQLETRLKTELKQLQKVFNSDFDAFGRQRIFLNKPQERARKRMNINLERFKEQFLLSPKGDEYRLANFSKEIERIILRMDHCIYHPRSGIKWSITWPD